MSKINVEIDRDYSVVCLVIKYQISSINAHTKNIDLIKKKYENI